MRQLECSTRRVEQVLDDAPSEVRAALQAHSMSVTDRILSALTTGIRMNDKVEEIAGLMREKQRRIDDLQGRVIRLETLLELARNRPPLKGRRWLGEEPDGPGV